MSDISQVSVKGTLFDIRDRITEEMALAEYPTREIAGELIHLTDAAEAPVKSLSITLTPTQSGTGDPSPTNIRPISGTDSVVVTRTGKNLLDSLFCLNRTNNGLTTQVNADGSITLTGTATSGSRYWNSADTLNLTLKAGTYTLSEGLRLDASGSVRKYGTFTLDEETTFRNVLFAVTSGRAYNTTFYPQLEVGSTATDYEPFGDTYALTLPQTVYSCVVDVTGGTVTIDKKYVKVTSASDIVRNNASSYYVSLSLAPDSVRDGSAHTVYSNKFVSTGNISARGEAFVNAGGAIRFNTLADYDSAEAMMTAVGDLEFVYPLATPQVIQLTPTEITTLLNENYIWANSGVISLTYRQKFDVRLTEAVAKVLPTETATGDIVSISDGAEDIPVKALSVAVEPVQAGSGDPSPDNIRTIAGWDAVNVVRTGKNLFDPNSADKEWVHTSDWAIITQNSAKSVRVKAVEGEIFTLSNANTASATNVLLLAFLSSDGTVISRNFVASGTTFITRTAPANSASLLAAFFTWSDVSNAQLELGSSATTYEPYQGTTYPIPLPSTVYGGTLDVATGVMTVDRAYVTADGSTIKATGGYGANGAERLPAISLTGASKGATAMTGVIASYLKTATSSSILQSTSNTVGIGSGGALIVLHINDIIGNNGAHGYNSDTELFAACNAYLASNPLQIAYKLATPTTITIDPVTISTLLGNNTLYADAGQVSVCYRADVGLYIDKRIAEVQALVLES